MKLRGLLVVSVAVAGIATPAFAQLPVPTVEAPAPVPTVQVPIPVPTVQAPVPVPTVQAPVPVPTVPDVPVPTAAPPSGGGSSGSSGSSGGSSGSAGSSGSSGSSGGSSGSSGSSGSTRGSSDSSRSSGDSSGSSDGSSAPSSRAPASRGAGASPTGTRDGRAGASRPPASSSQPCARRPEGGERRACELRAWCAGLAGAARRDCELRAIVTASSRCLDELSPAQRRVLELRAGVRGGPPRSRGQVAERLHMSERRVVRLERSGLRRLRGLEKAGACAPPARGAAIAAAGDVVPDAPIAAVGGEAPARGEGSARGGSRDDPRSRTGPREDERPAPIGGVAGESATNRGGGVFDLSLTPVLLLVAVAAVLLGRAVRRQPAGAPAVPVEPPTPASVPCHRSTLPGPGWNDPRPPGDRPDEWSGAPAPEPQHHGEWAPPMRRSPSRR